MSSIILALSFLVAAQATPEGWTEVRFHRVHLRNGNFIDGTLIANKPEEVILLLKGGEMAIRRDQVDKVELMKVKSYNDKAIILATPKGTTPSSTSPTTTTTTPVVETPEAIRKKVDMILFRYKNTRKNANDQIPIQDIRALGEEAVIYLAANSPKFDLQSQDAIAMALINLKPTGKVVDVLIKLLSHEEARSRALALTVLCAEASEPDKSKYARSVLRDTDSRVRVAALSAIGSSQDRDLFGDVVELCGDPEVDVRSRALRIAKNLAEKHGLKDDLGRQMAGQLTNPDAGVRTDSASLLGYIGQSGNWSALSKALNDSEAKVRAAAAQSLMILAVPESSEAITLALNKEDDHWARVYLAGAAQKMKIQTAVEPFLRWLGDPDEEIRKMAAAGLAGITGQNFGLDRSAWESWWEKARPK